VSWSVLRYSHHIKTHNPMKPLFLYAEREHTPPVPNGTLVRSAFGLVACGRCRPPPRMAAPLCTPACVPPCAPKAMRGTGVGTTAMDAWLDQSPGRNAQPPVSFSSPILSSVVTKPLALGVFDLDAEADGLSAPFTV
jgi:hypothetical protein